MTESTRGLFLEAFANSTNVEIEQAFLGTIFENNAGVRQTELAPEDFSDAVHSQIWRVMLEMIEKGEDLTPITMKLYLKNCLEPVGGWKYLVKLASAMMPGANLDGYALQIRDLASRRRLISLSERALEDAQDMNRPSDEIIAEEIGELEQIVASGVKQAESRRTVLNRITRSMDEDLPRFSTGLERLDKAMGGGLFAGKLYGMAARKKTGKTLLLGSISYNLNEAEIPHLFLPLEMGPDEIEHRNVARALGFNAIKFLVRNDAELPDRVAEHAVLSPNNIIYEYKPGATLNDIRGMIARAVIRHKIKGVVIDYLQLVGGKSNRDTEEYHLRNVAQSLANIARRENIFVLMAAQTNQDGNTRGGEGIRLACDQYYTLNRNQGEEGAWLEMGESRYTIYGDVGSEHEPGLILNKHGPHFENADLII